MLSEQAKLYLLAACLLGCLVTLLTSSSFGLGPRDLPVLRPAHNYCRKAKEADKSRCAEALQQAYRHVNMGGCPKRNLANALCENEWCVGGMKQKDACQKECAQVRTELQECISHIVGLYMKKYGLDETLGEQA